MAAMLTFHPRRALLEATASGLTFQLPIHRDHRVTEWEHLFELRPGMQTLWDHAFELPGGAAGSSPAVIYRVGTGSGALQTYDFPGRYAQRFDGIDKGGGNAVHSHPGSALYIGTPRTGIYIHGWPPCNGTRCITVLRQWDSLSLAIAREKSLSFAVFI